MFVGVLACWHSLEDLESRCTWKGEHMGVTSATGLLPSSSRLSVSTAGLLALGVRDSPLLMGADLGRKVREKNPIRFVVKLRYDLARDLCTDESECHVQDEIVCRWLSQDVRTYSA